MIKHELRYKNNLTGKAFVIMLTSIYFLIAVCGVAFMLFSLLAI
jgi:hypothetical protein|tara:strand:+ start:8853 stop:8984 length:132 start_codon:yes stop_codon:yes gene_type:complete